MFAESAGEEKMEANVHMKHLETVDWKCIEATVTRLFQLRKLSDIELATELPSLNDKLSQLSNSEVGPFIGEFYENKILKKCMIILRQELVEKKGEELVKKMVTIWTQFYTSILPTLQALFAPVQLHKLSVKALTLISFRDAVLLKTDISASLDAHNDEKDGRLPAEVRQMLLVLQNVHRTPPTESYFVLQQLVGKVVKSYLPMVARSRTIVKVHREPISDESTSKAGRSDTVAVDLSGADSAKREAPVKRRHSLTLGNIDKSPDNT